MLLILLAILYLFDFVGFLFVRRIAFQFSTQQKSPSSDGLLSMRDTYFCKVICLMAMGVWGTSVAPSSSETPVGWAAILSSTSMPETTLPNTV